jgi:single-strand DNA-binding protein
MIMSLNKILLLGNLGSDPEVRFMPSGKQTTQFSLATNRKYKLEGQLREETEWFHVVAFGRLAEIASEFLKKGRQVFIEGRLRTRNWTDTGGQKHYRTEVIVEGLRLIGKTNGTNPGTPAAESDDSEADPF